MECLKGRVAIITGAGSGMNVIVFLASDEAKFVNETVVTVNGG